MFGSCAPDTRALLSGHYERLRNASGFETFIYPIPAFQRFSSPLHYLTHAQSFHNRLFLIHRRRRQKRLPKSCKYSQMHEQQITVIRRLGPTLRISNRIAGDPARSTSCLYGRDSAKSCSGKRTSLFLLSYPQKGGYQQHQKKAQHLQFGPGGQRCHAQQRINICHSFSCLSAEMRGSSRVRTSSWISITP